MIKWKIEQNFRATLNKYYPEIKLPEVLIFDPPKEINADYFTNVAFSMAKKLNSSFQETALKIIKLLNQNEALKKIVSDIFEKNGYINFKLKDDFIARQVIKINQSGFSKNALKKLNKNKKIIIEYSSPNIAKKMHAGHLRSTIIGDALKNIFSWLGYKVISWNHLGDWGTQFGKLLYMYKKKYGSKKVKISLDELEKLYADFHQLAKVNPALEGEARQETKKLQSGDKINLNLWKYFTKISLTEFNKFYDIFGIKFDYIIGESFYNKYLPGIVKEALKKKVAKKSQGAVIIPLEKFKLPPFLIQKSDGAFLYSTTDLASLIYRKKKFNPAKIIYVVANEQTLHFQQLFCAARLLSILKENEETCVHIKFGLLLNSEGKKFSTREGKIVHLENLIDELKQSAYDLISKKNPELPKKEKEKIAKIIGIGAIKYNDLSRDRQGDIIFDKQKMLSLEGNSAPYLQYTFVRINSILKKAGAFTSDQITFLNPLEKDLAVLVLKFEDTVLEAAKNFKPNILADYLYELASKFHYFYETLPVLSSPEKEKKSRLILIKAVAAAIKEGLKILGIKTPEKM